MRPAALAPLAAAFALAGSALLAPAVASAASSEAGVAPATVTRVRYLMGTLCSASIDSPDTAGARTAIGSAFDAIARLEDVMSSWRSDSELARLNAAGDGWFACSTDLYAALAAARDAAALTGGAFDPTVEPLNQAWGMRTGGRAPSRAELERARSAVGWRGLELDPDGRRARFARPGMGVDLGGIGKGIALDRAAAGLRGDGFRSGLLNFGGEVLVLAAHAVEIADPAERLRPLIRIEVADRAVSTSAQSERGVTVKGTHVGHVLDPRTGKAVPGAGSVTVVAASATRADALSTALLVMGREAAAAFVRSQPDLGVLWLERAGPRVRAWKWNLEAAGALAPDAVEWMN